MRELLSLASLWLRDVEVPLYVSTHGNVRAFPKASRPQRKGNRSRKHK